MQTRGGVYKASQNQTSGNPRLAGESLAEELRTKMLRRVMDVVDAVRGVPALWTQPLIGCSCSSGQPYGTQTGSTKLTDSVGF